MLSSNKKETPETTNTDIDLIETEKVTEFKPKIITCFSTIPGSGAKHTALNLAFAYKQKNPDKTVALVDLDFVYPTLLANESSHDQVHGIDNLLDKIDSEQLTPALFRDNMIRIREDKENIHFLKGTQLKNNNVMIQRNHFEVIFEHLRNSYDQVFVNVSGFDNNSGTVYGLHHSDCVLMVLTNNYTTYTVCDDQLKLIKRYFHNPSQIFGIFNCYSNASKTEFGDWLFKNELKILAAIPYNEKSVDGADLFSTLLVKVKKSSKASSIYESILEKLI